MEGELRAPIPDPTGLFEPVIGRAPASWPWALPHLYAANVAPGPGEVVVSASAGPLDCPVQERSRQTTIGRLEVIGFWEGRFHVVHSESVDQLERARRMAREAFDSLPVRLLMECGRVREENTSIRITGSWPEAWAFVRMQDLGVLCAFLYESAVHGGAGERAETFRALVYFASPPTEQLLVYKDALEKGRELLGPFLSEKAHAALQLGLEKVKKWLH